MNKEEARTNAELMAAWADGASLQYRPIGNTEWLTLDYFHNVTWSFCSCEYRIKPKPIELWGAFRGDNLISSHRCLRDAELHLLPGERIVKLVEAE